MRCISQMEYQSTALLVHWYQSYHWYQWTTGIPPYSYLIHCENIVGPLNDMYFTNGMPIDCLVSPQVPIVPLVPMDDRNPPVLLPNSLRKHSNPLNEMHFTNGIPIDCLVSPLGPMDGQNPSVPLPGSLRKHSKPP